MNQLEQILSKTLMPAALAVGMYAMPSNAATLMMVEGPVITTGDYISNGNDTLGNPILEKRWDYNVSNSSTVGDANNMIEWHINAGSNNNIFEELDYDRFSSQPTISLYITDNTCGFIGLLPPSPEPFTDNNSIIFTLYTPADTQSALGLATGTSFGYSLGGDNFNKVTVEVPTIPEPSSGLLLLLAGTLAYQRKR
jgi:MprA protease rhombosortase-interaction domain-containing protein